ncbi:ABC transporter permease [Olivibacter sp. XZL3]|uniref:ABC transporter permease n=1 Tax=Olivibacter sp. XZL3 TaxID=1735116 RepID=UPI0010647C2E|nr:ABC transporter permease [Olivibacter sp. XZL3]
MDFYFAAILQGLCFAPMGLGIYLTMKIFNFPDITTDGSYTLGAVICALGLSHQLPFIVLLPLVLLGGAVAGSCTAFIHTKLKINALLAGILVMTALYSVNLTLLGRSNIPLLGYTNLFSFVRNPAVNMFLIVAAIVMLLIFTLHYLLRTDFGIAMRATGNNEIMVRSMGVNTTKIKWIGLAITNALVAFSGCLIAQFQGFTDINMGIGIVISGLGSVMIAEAIIKLLQTDKVWMNLLMVVVGVTVFQLVLAVTLSIGIDSSLLKLFTACFVLLIVAFAQRDFLGSAIKR